MKSDPSEISVPRRLGGPWAGRTGMLAGLLDAGLASLATFVVGIYAVRALDPEVLGAYALVYYAIFLVGIVPANLVFTPVEIAVVQRPVRSRTAHLGRSLKLGLPATLLAGLAVALWIPVAPSEVPRSAILPLTIGGIATAALSPVQDHVRRMLHTGGRSWWAAIVSAVQLVTVIGGLLALSARGVPAAWLPFGALALANLASLAIGAVGAWTGPRSEDQPLTLHLGELAHSGRWLVGGGLLNPATGFVSAAIVSHLAGAASLGYAEAARVVAQPVWVLAVGLSSVLGPRSMQAAHERRLDQAREVRRLFLACVLGAGAVNLVWFGAAWSLNPLAWLLPSAYVVPGLVAATICAQVLGALVFPHRSELLGARRESTYTRIELIASLVRAAVSTSALAIHAFAIPIGHIAVVVVRGMGFHEALSDVYASPHGGEGRSRETAPATPVDGYVPPADPGDL